MILLAMMAVLFLGCASRENAKENVYRGLYDGLSATAKEEPKSDLRVVGDHPYQPQKQTGSYEQYKKEREAMLQEEKK